MNFENFGKLTCAAVLILSTAGCATEQYIKRDEFDTTIGELRSTDARLASDLEGFRGQFTEMTQDLHGKFAGYDATIANLQGRLRVEMSAHFAYDDDSLREEDKPVLGEFSEIVRQYDPNVIVTVEGFTDAAGDPKYNQQLGQRRAEAVREFLVSDGGLHPDRVRAVSYGEDKRRMITPGTWGEKGAANRRVSLVIDYLGPAPRTTE